LKIYFLKGADKSGTVSLIGNVYQRNELMRVSDNDLKYRYIKMIGGINAEELSKLEDVFNCNDKK
jgi:hypothetical protein